jgi:hypothetical protein
VYLRLLPLLTTGRIELPPDQMLRSEMLGLERRTSRSGRDTVDHRPGAHDDLANAVALAAVQAARAGAGPSLPAFVMPSVFAEPETGEGRLTHYEDVRERNPPRMDWDL